MFKLCCLKLVVTWRKSNVTFYKKSYEVPVWLGHDSSWFMTKIDEEGWENCFGKKQKPERKGQENGE